jgi:hypothetical protein
MKRKPYSLKIQDRLVKGMKIVKSVEFYLDDNDPLIPQIRQVTKSVWDVVLNMQAANDAALKTRKNPSTPPNPLPSPTKPDHRLAG